MDCQAIGLVHLVDMADLALLEEGQVADLLDKENLNLQVVLQG